MSVIIIKGTLKKVIKIFLKNVLQGKNQNIEKMAI